MRILAAAICSLILLSLNLSKAQQAQKLEYFHQQMGTQFKIIIYTSDQSKAEVAAKAAFARIDVLNDIFSDYNPESELNQIASSTSLDAPQQVSPELWDLLQQANQLSKKSKGAFDITIGPLSKLWRRAFRKQVFPKQEQIAAAKAKVNYKNLKLGAKQQVQFLTDSMRLDAGGIAKGYAVDEAVKILKAAGFNQILVDGGGDLYAGTPPPGEKGWRILLKTVKQQEIQEAILYLNQEAIATSGDTYHFLEWEGQRYSHIIDPRTGLGVSERLLVSVRAPNCTTADALASAITVSGRKSGLKLAKKYKKTQVRIIIQNEKNPVQFGF